MNGPEGAAVPALGLSNKPVYQVDSDAENIKRIAAFKSDQYSESYFVSSELDGTNQYFLLNSVSRLDHYEISARFLMTASIFFHLELYLQFNDNRC